MDKDETESVDQRRVEYLIAKEDLTPEEIAELRAFTKKAMEKNKELANKKPSWLPDENAPYGEQLEFYVVTAPYKWQQIINIYEEMARKIDHFAKYSDDKDEKEHWLKQADEMRKKANEMRLKNKQIRADAEDANKKLDELK
jgi:hypothetical protein